MTNILPTPSENFDLLITSLTDWRGIMLAKLRQVIHDADPEIVEEWKYMGTPVMYHQSKMVVVVNVFKNKIKLGFLYGAKIPDPNGLFNGELTGNQRRSIEYYQGDEIKVEPLKKLILSAIEYNFTKVSHP